MKSVTHKNPTASDEMLLLVTNYAADWDEELDLKRKIIFMQQLYEQIIQASVKRNEPSNVHNENLWTR